MRMNISKNNSLIFPKKVLENRVNRLKSSLRKMDIDVALIRTLSTFIYLTGVKWLRPAIVIPADSDPIVFVAKGEEEGFKELSWIENIITYSDGGELMRKMVSLIRDLKAKRIGMEFGLEKDAYILFFETFKKLNPNVEVIDISPNIYSMKMFKDDLEIKHIKEAGFLANKAMEIALEIIKPDITETEIASYIYSFLYKHGSEEPVVYVNSGSHPRIHSEPLSNVKIREETFVSIIINADKYRYYANKSRSVFIGSRKPEIASTAEECEEEVYNKAIELTKPGKKFKDVIKDLDEIYEKYNMKNYRTIGYTHGVGLQIEEPPITTILPKHRLMEPKPRMVLAMIHSPIIIPTIGQVKKEDTFIVKEDGGLEIIT